MIRRSLRSARSTAPGFTQCGATCSLIIGVFLVAPLATGCGKSNRALVKGSVTLDDEPLEFGVINFLPADGNQGPTAGATIENGTYRVDAAKGVVLGKNRVTISSMQKTGRKIYGRDGDVNEERAEAIPPQYNKDSQLVHIIQSGENELNFDLRGRLQIEKSRREYPGR